MYMTTFKCGRSMKLEDCELAILRIAQDNAENKQKQDFVMTPEIQSIIDIVEDFIRSDKFICYGGTAINNILPEEHQFYSNQEVPDYDFYSIDALKNAKKLADLYFKHGYRDIEAKPSKHPGTFKVFVNGIGIADITQLDAELFNNLYKGSLSVNGILYADPQWLRQSMYFELSSPAGDVSRWEKVLKRLILLNKFHPPSEQMKCASNFQRKLSKPNKNELQIFMITLNVFIEHGCVFIGAYADSLYSKFMPHDKSKLLKQVPDFDVLATKPLQCLDILFKTFDRHGIKGTFKKHNSIGELINEHYEVVVEGETIAFIYEPVACQSYNIAPMKVPNMDGTIHTLNVKIGTIDTLLSYYLAFLYADRQYYTYKMERILCMCNFLLEVQRHNRLKQNGLLKRFTIECYGKQKTLESMRKERKEAFELLKNKRGSKEYEKYFLKYDPGKKTRKHKVKKKEPNRSAKLSVHKKENIK